MPHKGKGKNIIGPGCLGTFMTLRCAPGRNNLHVEDSSSSWDLLNGKQREGVVGTAMVRSLTREGMLLGGLGGKQGNQKTGGRPDGGETRSAHGWKQAATCEWGLVRKMW